MCVCYFFSVTPSPCCLSLLPAAVTWPAANSPFSFFLTLDPLLSSNEVCLSILHPSKHFLSVTHYSYLVGPQECLSLSTVLNHISSLILDKESSFLRAHQKAKHTVLSLKAQNWIVPLVVCFLHSVYVKSFVYTFFIYHVMERNTHRI